MDSAPTLLWNTGVILYLVIEPTRRLGTLNFNENQLYVYTFIRKLNRNIQTRMDGIYWGFFKIG